MVSDLEQRHKMPIKKLGKSDKNTQINSPQARFSHRCHHSVFIIQLVMIGLIIFFSGTQSVCSNMTVAAEPPKGQHSVIMCKSYHRLWLGDA